MQVDQRITLNEEQVAEILIKALGLGTDAKVSFSHYSGSPNDPRDPSYTTVSVISKTNLNVNLIK